MFQLALLARAGAVLALTAIAASSANAQSVMVSNFSQSFGSGDFTGVTPSQSIAQSFTTGSAATRLSQVSLAFVNIGGSGSGFSLSLYSNAGGQPGSLLELLSGNSSPTSNATFSYTSNALTPLAANNTYWVVASSSGGEFGLNVTFSTGQTSSSGWTLGDTALSGFGGAWSNDDDVLRTSVSASPIPEPGTYAAVAGLAMLGFAANRRYRSRLATR